jgi:hypothetical protein
VTVLTVQREPLFGRQAHYTMSPFNVFGLPKLLTLFEIGHQESQDMSTRCLCLAASPPVRPQGLGFSPPPQSTSLSPCHPAVPQCRPARTQKTTQDNPT